MNTMPRAVAKLALLLAPPDASDGHELCLDYRYTWLLDRTWLTAGVGASGLSSDLANYDFGVPDEEVARGVPAYATGSAVVPRIGLTMMRSLGSTQWQLLGAVEYQVLPSEIRRSPLLEPDSHGDEPDRNNGLGRVVLGLCRCF